MRDLAIVLALTLALPAIALIIRDAIAAADRAGRPSARALHVVWAAVPVVLLAVLLWAAVAA